MKTAALLIITIIGVWALAPYFPTPADVFTSEPRPKTLPSQEIKPVIAIEDIEQQVFSLINEAREAEGFLVLAWDKKLHQQSCNHSEFMVASQNFKHSEFNVLENCYWGINISPNRLAEKCFEAWMNSSRHKENILEPSTRNGAVGIAGDGINTFITFMAK